MLNPGPHRQAIFAVLWSQVKDLQLPLTGSSALTGARPPRAIDDVKECLANATRPADDGLSFRA